MRAKHLYYALTILRIPQNEFNRMNPGLFYDLIQIHTNRLPKKKDDYS